MFGSKFLRIKVGILGFFVNADQVSSIWAYWDKKNHVWKLNITYKNGRSNMVGYYGSVEDVLKDMDDLQTKLKELGIEVATFDSGAVYSPKDLSSEGGEEAPF